MTSADVTRSTRFPPTLGCAYMRSVEAQWAVGLAVHVALCMAKTFAAACSKVGTERRPVLLGSLPALATLRLASAASRVSACVMRRKGPSPNSRHLPWMNNRWIHRL